MKLSGWLITLLFLSLPVSGGKIATFKEPVNPTQILMDNQQIYIADFPHVYIYSAKDYKLKKKIGGEGEGPGQFVYLRGSLVNRNDSFKIYVHPEKIIASSQGKVTIYTKDGTYENEKRTGHRHDHRFYPIKEKYAALTASREIDNLFYIKLYIFDSSLKREKEIFRFKRFSQPPAGDINVVYENGIIFDTFDNKIFITACGREGSVIDILDHEGNKQYSIHHKYDKIPVTEADKKRYMNYYKAGPLRSIWDRFKKQIKFPVHFPGLRNFSVVNGKIYVLTFKKIRGKSEFIVFNINGKFSKKVRLPLEEKYIEYYPYVISAEKLFQLVENDDEQWELRVSAIE